MQNDLYQRGARKQSRTPRSESNVIIHWKSRLCLHKIDRGFTFSTIWLISLCYNKSASTLQM